MIQGEFVYDFGSFSENWINPLQSNDLQWIYKQFREGIHKKLVLICDSSLVSDCQKVILLNKPFAVANLNKNKTKKNYIDILSQISFGK